MHGRELRPENCSQFQRGPHLLMLLSQKLIQHREHLLGLMLLFFLAYGRAADWFLHERARVAAVLQLTSCKVAPKFLWIVACLSSLKINFALARVSIHTDLGIAASWFLFRDSTTIAIFSSFMANMMWFEYLSLRLESTKASCALDFGEILFFLPYRWRGKWMADSWTGVETVEVKRKKKG